VNSRYYEPGPFVDMEIYARQFVESYLATLGAGGSDASG